MRTRSRGFTMIELLVTMVVAGILLAIGVPSFRSFIANQRVKSTTTELMSAMLIARSEAVKRNATASVAPLSGTAWENGWSVKVGSTTLNQQEAVTSITVTPKDPSNPTNATTVSSVDFGSTGRPSAKAWFELAADSYKRCLKVDSSGIPSATSGACS